MEGKERQRQKKDTERQTHRERCEWEDREREREGGREWGGVEKATLVSTSRGFVKVCVIHAWDAAVISSDAASPCINVHNLSSNVKAGF